MGRAKKRPGSPAGFLSAISGWFSLSILARGCRRIWRGEFWFIGFGGATLLDRIGPPGRCSGGWPHDRNSWLMPRVKPPRVNPFYHPYARARARPWSARCYGVARQRDRSRQKAPGSPACFLSAISGWFSLSILARGCRRIWRGVLWVIDFGGATLLDRIGPPGRCSGGWPHDRNSRLMRRGKPP